jgi:hypothetical protein
VLKRAENLTARVRKTDKNIILALAIKPWKANVCCEYALADLEEEPSPPPPFHPKFIIKY